MAFIFNQNRIKPTRNNTTKYSSFEVLECVSKIGSSLIRLCVIYRSTQVSSKESYNQTKTVKFFDQFSDYLDNVLGKGGTPVICGDFNFHMEDSLDLVAQRFKTLYESKGFQQHVSAPTHVAGGTLDLVLTPKNVTDNIRVTNLQIDSDKLEPCQITSSSISRFLLKSYKKTRTAKQCFFVTSVRLTWMHLGQILDVPF